MSVSTKALFGGLFLLLVFVHSSIALLPIECAHNVTHPGKVCCPKNPHNQMVCGGPHMGVCTEIVVPDEQIPSVFIIDDRLRWPTRFFKHACQCKGNFYGVSCNQCWYGWTGKNCDIPEHRIRRDIRTYSHKELEIFKDVVRRSSFWPSGYVVVDESTNDHTDPIIDPKFEEASVHYFVAYNHRYGSRTTLYKNAEDCAMYGILDFNHDGVIFPTWHRYFMLQWERWLGEIAEHYHGVKDFSVPYWDWIGGKECDICNDRFIGGEGETDDFGVRISRNHPWHNMTEYCYEPSDGMVCYGCQRSGILGKVTRSFNSLDFPDQDDYSFVFSLKNYFVPGERDSEECQSFHMALEGFCGPPDVDGSKLWTHNKFHNMIDGSMCCGSTATNDPIFILHHTLIDKLFSIWYMKYKPTVQEFPQKGVRPGHCRDCFMVGFVPPVRNSDMFIDHRILGYDYDNYLIGSYAKNGKPPLDILK